MSIAAALADIQSRISAAAQRVGRAPNDLTLLAVSKTFPAQAVSEAFDAGQRCFGESKYQEAEPKITQLDPTIDWHFIGNLQRNKVRKILPIFSTIHSISSFRLADYVNTVAGDLKLKPKIFLEVNIGNEESKDGFPPEEIRNQFADLLGLKNVVIQGLMAIPPAEENVEAARPYFKQLRELQSELGESHNIQLPHLSMGMSSDFELAIEEGATIVRVGSSIFGRRF